MKINEVRAKISGIRSGNFFRITYQKEVPVKASFKGDYTVSKIVEKTVRTGISYANISGVEKVCGASTPWWHWEEKNRIAKHNTKDSMYLTVMPIRKGGNVRVKYMVNGVEVSYRELYNLGIIRDSYWNEGPELKFQTINIDNIMKIGR